MRQIDNGLEPVAFMNWRAASRNDINYGYSLVPSAMKEEIKLSLISAQRGLCAYTGIKIAADRSHIEHLLPQAHCKTGVEDVAYSNLVACYPAPNHGYVPFGAIRKENWPTRAEWPRFVSPRSDHCEDRFSFNLRGRISTTKLGDVAASTTIERLGLDHHRLESLRREAIDATLQGVRGRPASLDLPSARRRLGGLEAAEAAGGLLEPFCFALKQALRKHIRRLEGIREQKGKDNRP